MRPRTHWAVLLFVGALGASGQDPQDTVQDPYANARLLDETVKDGRRVRLVERPGRYECVLVDGARAMVGDHVIVKAQRGATEQDVADLAARCAARLREKLYGEDLYLVAFAPAIDGVERACKALAAEPQVEYAEPDYVLDLLVTPNDPDYSLLWGLSNINAPLAWDTQTGSASVRVGAIDTGVAWSHADLAANIWTNPGEIAGNGVDDDGNGRIDDVRGWDFGSGDNNPQDQGSHGTHTAGTIGAVGNNATGVTGVCWTVSIVPLKIADNSGNLLTSAAVQAVNYATANGCKVTSNSWGGGGYSSSLYSAISAANTAGSLFVAAAGNSSSNNDTNPMYPASYNLPNIISVLAITSSNGLASFSSYGATTVDLGAPGVSIRSTVPTGYASMSGTSMATPHVAGACALVFAQFPTQTHSWVKNRILSTATPTSSLNGRCVTEGRLNLTGAINGVPPTISISSPASGATLASQPATFTGSASDPDGSVASVTWASATASGTSAGTTSWSASVPLAYGSNTVVFTATDDEGRTATASRTVTFDPPPALVLSTDALSFTGSGAQTLGVSNGGGQTLSWSATGGAAWLTLSATSGSLGYNESENVTFTADATGLSPGTYNATITFSAPGAAGSPRAVTVTLTIAPPPPPQAAGGGGGGGHGGKCGMLGLDVLLIPLALLVARRAKHRRRGPHNS
jgi:subtilisin family serine protease